MTNKHIMIFQTAFRKYVDMQIKSYSGFFSFIHRFQRNNQKKFWTKNAVNFQNALIFLRSLRIQKLKFELKSFLK
jgi:hypothetical protein